MSKITWWGAWENNAANADSFTINVYTDNPGGPFGAVPGTLVATYPAETPSVTATGFQFPTALGMMDEQMLEVTLPATLSLAPGNYWIEIYSNGSSGSGYYFIWEMAPQDFINGSQCMAWSLDTPGITWWPCTPFPETDMALLLEGQDAPALNVTNLVAGGSATVTVDFATPNGNVRHGLSLHGAGPISTPFGDLLLSAPYIELPIMAADAAGQASMSSSVPPTVAGMTIWFHALDLSSQTFSNGFSAVVQ